MVVTFYVKIKDSVLHTFKKIVKRADLMLNVLIPPPRLKTNQRGMKKPLEVMDMFITLIVVMVSWVYYAHVSTHQIVYIKYVHFWYFSYISKKLLQNFNMKKILKINSVAHPGPHRPPCQPSSAMIKAILIFNNHGKPRLSKFYQPYSEDTQQQIIRETFHLVSKRDENVCNFLEGGLLIGGSDNKLIYRHYATLYFVFCVDSSESELGILDLIQVFVETLDKCFENVCELDLIFHVDKVHNILAEMVMGGMVLETNMNEIVTQIDAQNKLEKSEAGLAGAPARAVSAVKNMNLPEIPRNINIGDISIKVPNLPSFK